MKRSLINLQNLLEDEVTDDLTKWRNFCFSQLMQIQYQKFYKRKEKEKMIIEGEKINNSFDEVCKAYLEIIKSKNQLCQLIEEAKDKENAIRLNIEKAHQSYERQTNISLILQNAPTFFKTRMQVFKVKMIDISKKMEISYSNMNKIIARLTTINQKLHNLIQVCNQNRTKYELLQEENNSLQKKINDSKVSEFSHEIESLAIKFKNTTEASKTLFAIDDKIAFYESELKKTNKLEYKPSDCGAIEILIEQEKQKQKDLLESITRQYDTEQLEQEISNAKQTVNKLTTELNEMQQSTSLTISEIRSEFSKQEEKYQFQIQENDNRIEALTKKINELSKLMPVYSTNEKVSKQTQTAFPLPTYF